jgi:hypothetical protein
VKEAWHRKSKKRLKAKIKHRKAIINGMAQWREIEKKSGENKRNMALATGKRRQHQQPAARFSVNMYSQQTYHQRARHRSIPFRILNIFGVTYEESEKRKPSKKKSENGWHQLVKLKRNEEK